jgi:hypothetical protein
MPSMVTAGKTIQKAKELVQKQGQCCAGELCKEDLLCFSVMRLVHWTNLEYLPKIFTNNIESSSPCVSSIKTISCLQVGVRSKSCNAHTFVWLCKEISVVCRHFN